MLAWNLAILLSLKGYKVAIAEQDQNYTCTKSSEKRSYQKGLPPVTVHRLTSNTIAGELILLNATNDIVVLDTAPFRLDEFSRECLIASDFILAPILASPPDVCAAEIFIEKLQTETVRLKKNIQAAIVITYYDGTNVIARRCREQIINSGLPVLKQTLSCYLAYDESLNSGLAVTEFKGKLKNPEASREITLLLHEFINHLKKADLL